MRAESIAPRVRWRTALGTLVVAASACAAPPDEGRSPHELRDRARHIDSELDALEGAHPWAGRYAHSPGDLTVRRLHLAPAAGYTWIASDCLAVYHRCHGRIEAREGRIVLVPETPEPAYLHQGLGLEFVPIESDPGPRLVPVSAGAPTAAIDGDALLAGACFMTSLAATDE